MYRNFMNETNEAVIEIAFGGLQERSYTTSLATDAIVHVKAALKSLDKLKREMDSKERKNAVKSLEDAIEDLLAVQKSGAN